MRMDLEWALGKIIRDFYGLYIDCSLVKGSSHTCETYLNKPLSETEHFDIAKLEVYGFRD